MGLLDLTGHVYGKLTVVSRDLFVKYHWICKCDCGARCSIHIGNLRRKNPNKSCGCHQRHAGASTPEKHGKTGTPEHTIWKKMRYRCLNPKCVNYPDYGGRGIKVCERWNSFTAFLQDMGPRPTAKHEIERRDCNGDYCPENCYWIHGSKQNRNRRDSVRLTLNGVTKSIHDWADEIGIPVTTLKARIDRGWTHEKTLTTPKDATRSKDHPNFIPRR